MVESMINAAYLSYQLATLPDREAYLRAAAACLLGAIHGDTVGLNNLDLAAGSAQIFYYPPDPQMSDLVLAAVMDKHPLVDRYATRPDDTAPHRISDFLSNRQWRSHVVYSELFVPIHAQHQLGIPTLISRDTVRGWAINRSGRDFNDPTVAVAASLQPILTVLDQIYTNPQPTRADPARQTEAQCKVGVTDRELELLTHLADGLSAQQIAGLCRISVRTVRKHLENAYAKLDCHDRMTAVIVARNLGLL